MKVDKQQKTLPLGYWIKQADNLLTQGIDELQTSFGLTRLKWQILHTIQGKEQINSFELTSLLQPFANPETVNKTLTELENELLLIKNNEQLSLTAKGIDLHAACFEQQKIFRQTAMMGITEQQYEQTVATLQKIVTNLTPTNRQTDARFSE